MEENYAEYITALQTIPSFGAITIRRLISKMGNAKNVWEADDDSLTKTGLIKVKMLNEIHNARSKFSFPKFEKRLKDTGIKYITYLDEKFPKSLQDIYNPPAVLYYKGKYTIPEKTIGIVGARKCSPYGLNNSRAFARELSRKGVTIISGGARGIDTAAHRGALEADRPTISVMGCGLDYTYPRENYHLYRMIEENGLLLSEYPPGTKPIGKHFPMRNRIISGLSQGIIVIEAKASSGSLITADMANNDGRDVFAIPGSIHSEYSQGTNWLIKQGAIPITEPEDVLKEYNWDILGQDIEKIASQQRESVISLTLKEKAVYESLSYDIIKDIDEIVKETGYSVSELGIIMLKLEMNGYIAKSDIGGYTKVTRG